MPRSETHGQACDVSDLPRRHGKPGSETLQKITTCQTGALPTHPDGAWRWTTQKQARRARVHAPKRNSTEKPSKFTKQRTPPKCQEARPINPQALRRPNRIKIGKSYQVRGGAHQDATKRDLPESQTALANGAATASSSRSSSVTHRKAPAANQPRNNVASHRQCEPQPESKSKHPFKKMRHGITFGLTCGPESITKTHQSGRAGLRRKIEAEPRRRPSITQQPTKPSGSSRSYARPR